ncbi:hypothetical protein XENTR_v10012429 [Xenopus tropicalis]|nr:hypothetical protein XENTR_v10012429 [Xenopus tropicalis]
MLKIQSCTLTTTSQTISMHISSQVGQVKSFDSRYILSSSAHASYWHSPPQSRTGSQVVTHGGHQPFCTSACSRLVHSIRAVLVDFFAVAGERVGRQYRGLLIYLLWTNRIVPNTNHASWWIGLVQV